MGFQAKNLLGIKGISHSFAHVNDPELPTDLFRSKQVHGAAIIGTGEVGDSGRPVADGICTQDPTPIAIETADCLPILMASTQGRFAAVLHGGWQGLKAGIIANAFAKFSALGVSTEELVVAVGPAIKPCCYEVSHEFIEGFEASEQALWEGRSPPWFTERPLPSIRPSLAMAEATHGNAWFDLSAYGVQLLRKAGITHAQIEVSDVCTFCTSKLFGSYRRRSQRAETKAIQYSWIQLERQ